MPQELILSLLQHQPLLIDPLLEKIQYNKRHSLINSLLTLNIGQAIYKSYYTTSRVEIAMKDEHL